MNIICKIFGHKFIATIVKVNLWTELAYRHELPEPICKRCGLTITQIGKATADNSDFKMASPKLKHS